MQPLLPFLKFTAHQACAYGGQRPKWTALLHNHPSFFLSEPVAFRRVYGLEAYSRTSGDSIHHRQSVSDTRVTPYQLDHEGDSATQPPFKVIGVTYQVEQNTSNSLQRGQKGDLTTAQPTERHGFWSAPHPQRICAGSSQSRAPVT